MAATRIGFLPPPGMAYDRGITLAEEFGFDFIEAYAGGEPWRAGSLAAPGLQDRLADAGLDLMVHLPFPTGIGSPLDATRAGAREDMRETVRTAADRGAEKGVLHLHAHDARAANLDPADCRPHLLEAASALTGVAGDHGVEICVENLPSGPFDIDGFDPLFAETGASMTLDTGHAVLAGWSAADVAEFLTAHPDRVSHVHLNDTRAPAAAWGGEHDEHLPFGAGAIDFETLLGPARTGAWTGTLSFEVVSWDREYLELGAEKLRRLL